LKPDFGEGYVALGNVFNSTGNHKEAIHHYELAIKLNPQDPLAHNNLGVAYLTMGKNKEGLVAFKRAATLRPESGQIHLNLARAYLHLSDRDSALAEYGVLKTLDSALAKVIYAEIFQTRILKATDLKTSHD
jgi:superkiller protein 3